MSAEKLEQENATAALLGGTEVTVKYRGDLKEEVVLVRDLAVKDYPRLLSAMNDEERQVEIYVDRAAGWGATLTGQSLNAVMEAGEALNKDPFFGWFLRKQDQVRRLAPGKIEELVKTALAEAARSPNGSPASPSRAG